MSPSSFWKTPFRPFLALAALGLFVTAPPLPAITLTGSNGRAVEFHLIETASPKGLVVKMAAEGPAIGITWDKLDLAALQKDHPEIHAAYLRAQAGETVALGISEPAAMKEGAPTAPAPEEPKYPGWVDTQVGNVEYMLQMPASKPRGILLISQDDFGDAFRWVRLHERGTGYWGIFQTKFDMALLSYSTGDTNRNPTKVEDFMFPEKGSGKALFAALAKFASKLKQPGLVDLPIAIYGTERSGTAFGYNFVQHYPERILAAAFYDGGFYDAEPTEASAKVPMLFMWGQYSNRPELWGTQNTAPVILAKAAPLKPLWTNGREFRGRGEVNEVIEHFGKQYLIAMVEARLPKDAPEAPAPETEDKPAEGEAEAGAAEAPAAAAGGLPVLPELNRAEGSVGNVLTGEVKKITDPDAVLGEEETFLPNAVVIRYWKEFVLGELKAPEK